MLWNPSDECEVPSGVVHTLVSLHALSSLKVWLPEPHLHPYPALTSSCRKHTAPTIQYRVMAESKQELILFKAPMPLQLTHRFLWPLLLPHPLPYVFLFCFLFFFFLVRLGGVIAQTCLTFYVTEGSLELIVLPQLPRC